MAQVSRRNNTLDHKSNAVAFLPMRRIIAKKDVQFTVALFGMKWHKDTRMNWSLAPFKEEGDAIKNPQRAARISYALATLGSGPFFAPTPTDFNGLIAGQIAFEKRVALPGGFRLWRGVKADAVALPRGSGFTFSSAGCPLFIASDGERFFAAHAGFPSLFRATEPHKSVINNIAERFPNRSNVETWAFFSIRPEDHRFSLDDPNPPYRIHNEQVQKELRKQGYEKAILPNSGIDLISIIRMQCDRAGIGMPARTPVSYLPQGAYHTRMRGPERDHRNLTTVFLHGIK